jgi:hypothetical protein
VWVFSVSGFGQNLFVTEIIFEGLIFEGIIFEVITFEVIGVSFFDLGLANGPFISFTTLFFC